ncbi:short-chain dehydrogenase [Moorena producens PAL-8-15-08-1]|uniref:Short-chain dehydrogenase n=1 Tax=Moorena producens PAL-8-15-08-1 TaxID=1458985 RepID=A0A1D8TW65_9CYAN|nr:type I polyketide synthase [Moorena producens]AOX01783.1 short-chain dehydrogenase [Moorena producens PAL-8-15-08-1]
MSNYSLGNGSQLSTQQRLLIGLQQANAKLDAVKRAQTEPIAIIGMGCHLPGGVDNPESYWHLLHEGIDAITEVPSARWNLDEYYDPNPEAPGKTYTRCGGFLQQPVDRFDSQFFGISPREAVKLDPQQRLLLEVVWEAIENAGLSADQLRGTQTGVFVGLSSHDYEYKAFGANPSNIDAYSGLGNAQSIAVGRISYILGLLGPTFQLDTACSSSLVAVHLACQSLRAKESNLALVGGVNLMLSPAPTIFFCKTHALSADGRCKTFDAAADGYGRGEGCGIVVLKRLSDAIADADNILALIRGSAINHDGASSGLTVPNKKAQQLLIHQALDNAKVDPKDVSYIEAHGTGTSLGDPIEVGALGEFFGKNRPDNQPLTIASAKTNIGHLEAASGVAGLIKVILALQHEKIPPHLNFNEPNPRINWKELQVRVPTTVLPWPRAEKRRLAGVSAFGFSGTNAHVVVEEAPVPDPIPQGKVDRPVHLLALSTRTEAALKELIIRYQKHHYTHPELTIGDICFSANTGRKHFNHRLSVVAKSVAELSEKLAAFNDAQDVVGVCQRQLPTTTTQPKIAFLFTGQGSQYVDMGRELYSTQPTFRKTLEQCDAILGAYQQKPLLSVLYPEPGETSPIDETAYTQPALFAIEYALFQLWKSWGIEPDVVMGHSVGEYVAACVAGVFSLEDGLKLIAHRGKLMQELPPDGKMVAVLASLNQVQEAIEPYAEKVAIAAINGPMSLVISGQRQALEAVCATLAGDGVKIKSLQVNHAFHSALMEPMLGSFEAVAQELTYSKPRIPIISNVTGQQADDEIATPQYWVRHVRQPVKFAWGMKTLGQEGYQIFVEIGSKPILLGMGRQCLPEGVGVWLPSLRPGQEDWQQLLQSLGQLYVQGVVVDWSEFDRDYPRRKVLLPTYPWQRQRYWIETSENDSQKAAYSNSENKTTTIVDWLNHGNTQQLLQQLEKVGKFTPEQTKVLPEMLQILVKQHQEQLTAATVKDWLYQVQWKPLSSPVKTTLEASQNSQEGHWLIFADSTVLGQALAANLQQQGHQCTLVYARDAYQIMETGIYGLNPGEPGDFELLFQEVIKTSQLPLKGIIHLWSLDAVPEQELTISSLEQSQRLSCGSVLHLLQALLKQNLSASARLWLITRGAQPVASQSDSVAVAQAPIWGLGKVAALEHPQLWGGMVDLDPSAPQGEVEMLLAQIQNTQGEDHLAFREGFSYVPRLVKQVLAESKEVLWDDHSTYLITGGLGALGLQVAQWMVSQGARHLVLTGRREASGTAIEIIRELEQLGTKVLLLQADVSKPEDVAQMVQVIKSSLPPLKGIIHAAGVLDDSVLQMMSWESLRSVMAPKLEGAWNLHTLTQNSPLDFFICFSSVASLLGSPGQGNYAAANAFMDGLVYHRRAMGLPGLSINWGPWSTAGMAVNLDSRYQSRMVAMGISPLASEQGLQILGQLLEKSLPQVGVLPVEWSVFQEQFSFANQMPLLAELVTESESTKTKQHELLERLESAPECDRQNILITHIQTEVAKVLGLDSSDLLDPDQGFVDMGMDSLMAVELKNRLQNNLRIPLAATLAIEYPTIQKLSKYLAEEVMGWRLPEKSDMNLPKIEEEHGNALSEVKQIAEDDVESLIAKEVEELKTLLGGSH